MFTQEPFESHSPSSHLYTWHIQQIPHLEQYLRLIPYSQGTVMGGSLFTPGNGNKNHQ